MHVHLERSGGFAGIRHMVTVDTETLSPEERQELQSLLEATGFFDLPEEITGPPGGVDRFFYSMTIENDREQHTVRAGEAGMPAAMRALVDWLMKKARKA